MQIGSQKLPEIQLLRRRSGYQIVCRSWASATMDPVSGALVRLVL
jgi:hypothetical protein